MNPRIHHIPPCLLNPPLNLPRLYSQTPRQQCHRYPIQPLHQLLSKQHAHHLQPLPLRPRPNRPLEMLLRDIHEARLLKILLVASRVREVLPELFRCSHECMREGFRCASGIRVVDAPRREHDVLQLQVAAGGERRVGFGDYGGGVLEAGYEGAAVDEIEGVREGPVVFSVVDYEAAVGRDAALH